MSTASANNLEDTRAIIGDSLCLNSAWLDYERSPTQTDGGVVTNTAVGCTLPWTDYASNYFTYWGNSWPSVSKIELKLSEVMYLRELAAGDKKLRKVLKKFAPYIEITVDFPGTK